ncbi:MAG: hypothetical protein HZB59_01540 [Ignavibacteriales bacterium]|nr:hypothetical protein [Ignavibacteriales bacterium]
MNYSHLVTELEQLAKQLGINIRYEKGDFEGGFCVLKDQKVVVVNKRLLDSRKASALALALNDYGVELKGISDKLRIFVEDEAAKLRRSDRTQ